jgi:hypothetical protein
MREETELTQVIYVKPWYHGPLGWAVAIVLALAGILAVYSGYRKMSATPVPAASNPATPIAQPAAPPVQAAAAPPPAPAPAAPVPAAAAPAPASALPPPAAPAEPIAPAATPATSAAPSPAASAMPAPAAPASPAAPAMPAEPASPAQAAAPADAPAPPAPADLQQTQEWVAKEAAFGRFYRKPTMCDNPVSEEVRVDCANRYIRARRNFDAKWAAEQKKPAKP